MGEQRLMNLEETCQYLSISAPTLRRMVAQKLLPKPIRIGRAVRWDKKQIDAQLDGERAA